MSGAPTTERLRADVEMLAGYIGERHIWRPEALARAAEFIRMALAEAGYVPGAQPFEVRGVPVQNIEAIARGADADAEVVVVGAHYDTIGGSPGANDNGTGIASVLELARRFAGQALPRTIRFVAFTNEEPPFFQSEEMGSLVYARAARQRGDRITGMLSLETMGYYSDEPGSQQYPDPLGRFFPDVGNFIGVVGNPESAGLVEQIHAAFTAHTAFPIQAAPMPGELPGAGWSDHWSFWQAGYPAVMVTDTAPFRYPWYHTAEDTPDKVDFTKLALVVDGLEAVVRALATD
jgi:Zn-dependent M28 family amino/carboxypeptidase